MSYLYSSNVDKRHARAWSDVVGWAVMSFFVLSYIFSAYEGQALWAQSSDALIMLGANYAPLTWHGQEWRLFTHMFLHSNVFHLLVNSLAFWAVWRRSAMVFHGGTQLYIFVVSGIVSGWVGASHQFDSISVGSSGAIVGLLAAVVGWSVGRTYIRKEVRKAIAGFPAVVLFVVCLAGLFLPGMDAYANIGGALAGLVFGIFVSSKSEEEQGLVTAIVLCGVSVALLCAAMVFSRPSVEKMQQVQREQVSDRALEYIHETDKQVELAMKALWGVPVETEKTASSLSWKQSWHTQVIAPLERNAAMAAGLSAEQEDVHFAHLMLLQRYTTARLQEARLLERHREQVHRIGDAGPRLREKIVLLNQQMEALTLPKPSGDAPPVVAP